MIETEAKLRDHRFAAERHLRIREMLQQNGRVDIHMLTEAFGVSSVTVRRDLAELEAKGLLQRTHGGAVSAAKFDHDPSFATRELVNVDEKRRIGAAIAALVRDGDNTLIDSGSTAFQVAAALADREGLTVITNSLPVAAALKRSKVRLFVVGGEYREANNSLVGPLAAEMVREFGIDKAILGVSAVDLARGTISTTNFAEAAFQKSAIEAAEEVIVAADYSKFGRSALCTICPLETVDLVVTDSSVKASHLEALRYLGVRTIAA
jgi:DeoR/GlpR family transcriptional regulator of sugar metabolism